MSKRMTAASIIAELKKVCEFGLPISAFDVGFNRAVSVEAKGRREPNFEGNNNFFWDGRFVNPQNEDAFGYNAGVEAVENYKQGKEMTTEVDKTDEQRKFDLRFRCFGMAQQAAPRHMNGAAPEPPAEIIKRAMFLEHYFTTGTLLQDAQLAAAIGKAK